MVKSIESVPAVPSLAGGCLPKQISAGVFGSRRSFDFVRVDPRIVIEVADDTATQAGRYRHALGYLRIRHDTTSDAVNPSAQ